MTQFGNVLDFFVDLRLEFGLDTIWGYLRQFLVSCNWNLATTQFGIVLEYFR